MLNESKILITDFIDQDRFELNTYISHLFHQFYNQADDDKKYEELYVLKKYLAIFSNE